MIVEKEKDKKPPKKPVKKVLMDKYFGKAPVFGDGVKYQRKLRDE